jgi:predicted alpha/beta superfamily hydrolase
LLVVVVGLACAKPRVVQGPAVSTAAAASSTANAAQPSPPPKAAPVASGSEPVVRIGAEFRYPSAILKDERAYWIDLPNEYESAANAQKHYPVLYLFDAERFFAAASATVKFMSQLGSIPEMIVVGIPSTEHRTRDMTPTHSLRGPHGESTQRGAKSGGGDAFLSSLQKELIPLVEATYRTMPYRLLAGHSLSGLFVLHAFLQDPASFHAIIAMDPSLWWDGHLLAKRASTSASLTKHLRNAVYVGTANHDAETNGGIGPKTATQSFARALQARGAPSFRTKLQAFEDENHGSVPLPSFYYGLSFTFDGYRMPKPESVEDPAAIVAHYRQFSEQRGATFDPPESAFSTVAYVLLFEHKKVDQAVAVLEENVKRHPASPLAHDYLGQAYLAKEDKVSAVRCFERVLQLKPGDQDAARQLESARGK